MSITTDLLKYTVCKLYIIIIFISRPLKQLCIFVIDVNILFVALPVNKDSGIFS